MAEHARVATGPAMPAGIDEILLPIQAPSNIRTDGRFKVEAVTNDLYNISERIREIDERLLIYITEDRKLHLRAYTIMQEVAPGREEFVFRCAVLDARVLEHIRYLLKVPFEQRFKEAERRLEKLEQERQEHELDELTERIGLPMVRDLLECGFIESSFGDPRPRRFGRG